MTVDIEGLYQVGIGYEKKVPQLQATEVDTAFFLHLDTFWQTELSSAANKTLRWYHILNNNNDRRLDKRWCLVLIFPGKLVKKLFVAHPVTFVPSPPVLKALFFRLT